MKLNSFRDKSESSITMLQKQESLLMKKKEMAIEPVRGALFFKQARMRKFVISGLRYKLALALLRGSKTFHGQVYIRFTMESLIDTLFLDFTGESII